MVPNLRTKNPEAAAIRSQLRIRHTEKGFEVFTTVHGSGVFKWYIIDQDRANWYLKTFPELKLETIDDYK